tara:strand:+ start:6134 stop:6721 length:588 start_codon:yes stop_codon:yes gene_type:complete
MDYITYALGLIIFLMLIKICVDSDYFFLTCIISPVDNEKYCVRQRKNIDEAVELLSTMNNKLKELVKYVHKKYPNKDAVKRLHERYNPKKVIEISPISQHTAYSENKGEKLAFCLNKERNIHSSMIDINTLVFVGIHELSHIASVTKGHGDEFWDNFKFLLENAVEAKIYKPVNYNKNNTQYCGMKITDSPIYDL